jgi:hypothetical protein
LGDNGIPPDATAIIGSLNSKTGIYPHWKMLTFLI